MDIPLIKSIVVIFALSILVLLIFHRFRIPQLVGLILTGLLAGPHVLGFINDPNEIELLARIGIIFLLFTIGIEFSPKRMIHLQKPFFIGGTLQVVLTVLAGVLIAKFLDRPLTESVFLGFLISLSSTAIVLKLILERSEAKTAYGKVVISILIFQDIIVVPMMLLTPFLGGAAHELLLEEILWVLLKAFILLGGILISALKVVPPLLDAVVKTRSRELFLLTVLTICFSVAYIASLSGLSISLGAFLAGMILSESDYRHKALGNIIPFQDIFISIFFISIGMLIDASFFLEHLFLILAVTCVLVVLKATLATISILTLGLSLRIAILSGLALSQIGEFSFVLIREGMNYRLGTPFLYQLFLAVSALTMMLTPLLIQIGPWFAHHFRCFPWPRAGALESLLEEAVLDDEFDVSSMSVEALKVRVGSHLAGKTVDQSFLSQLPGISILMIRRGGTNITQVAYDTVFKEGDLVVILGEKESIKKIVDIH